MENLMNDNATEGGATTLAEDDLAVLYRALSTMEDALADGYHSRRPIPVFAPLQHQQPQPAQDTADQAGITRGGTARKILPLDPAGLATLNQELVRCRACRLATTRKQVVPGTGSAGAALLVLGEYPSDDETPGLPFARDAGLLMARMLAAIGLDRTRDCFETTAVKCRPPMDRDPSPDELASCLPFLERQLMMVQPKAILAFGRISAQILLGSREALPRLRGRVHQWRGIPLVATYHPGTILKDESLKRPAWEDLKLLKTILGHG
jgi:DNA polymerase